MLLIFIIFINQNRATAESFWTPVWRGGLYGALIGTGVGVASYPLSKSIRGVFMGTSVGLYLGVLLGIYASSQDASPQRSKLAQTQVNGLRLNPKLDWSESRGSGRDSLSYGAELTYRF